MSERCPCETIEGHRCTRPIFNDYPFCGTHLNQLILSQSGNSFKRGRVLRTAYRGIEADTIQKAIDKWRADYSEIVSTDPIHNHRLLKEILDRRGLMTVGALTECYNSRLQVKYSSTQIGRALTALVNTGEVARSSTRSQKMTVNKTTTYELRV